MIKLMKKRGKNGAKSEKNGLKIIQEAQSDTTVPRNIYAHIYAPFISWYAPKILWCEATERLRFCYIPHCGMHFWAYSMRSDLLT